MHVVNAEMAPWGAARPVLGDGAANQVPTITPTKITTFLGCPRKFAFRYAEKRPAEFKPAGLAFGAAVHSALQLFHDKKMQGEVVSADEVAAIFLADFAAQQVEEVRFKDSDDPAKLAELGEALVRLYVTEFADLKVVAAEWPFQVPLHDPDTGEVIGPDLKGIFDLVLRDDVLVEIKTAARAYDSDGLARNIQISAYAYAYRRVCGRDPKIRVVALMKQRKPRVEKYEVTRTPADDGWFVHLAAEVARSIDAGAFPPNPGWQCAECEYQKACAMWRGRSSMVVPGDGRRRLTVVEKEVNR